MPGASWKKRSAPQVPTGSFHGDLVSIVNTGIAGKAVCYIELSGFPMTVLRGLQTWRTSYQIENPKIPTHLHFDATRFRHPISPSMDELNHLADDYEWFLQANALGVIKRKADLGDREASFQPRGQYLFEVEPGSGEWLQIGNEFAIRSNGLPSYYHEQVIAAVQNRLAALGPNQLVLLAALMRHYQHRVYEPKLEVDETGAQLPSPSLPNITARRLYEQWFKRARARPGAVGFRHRCGHCQPAAVDRGGAQFGQRRLHLGSRARGGQARDPVPVSGQRGRSRARPAGARRGGCRGCGAGALQGILGRCAARPVFAGRDGAADRARRRRRLAPRSGTCNGIRRPTSGRPQARSWNLARCSTMPFPIPITTYPTRTRPA
ncbi:hypothetical protein LP419_27265 [Massilia sp. H-1]|nr:hypothetical protein LP419_27265 [Massilia sp. H-1]